MPLSRTAERHPFPRDEFRDVLEANAAYAEAFRASDLGGRAARGLAVVTCIDSRIDPLGLLGMAAGDVKIVRNAGARVTDDVLRTLALATFLLGVRRILILPHTDCKMASAPEAEIHATIRERYGVETRSIEFRTVEDQESALVTDVVRVRSFPLLAPDVTVAGAIYDVRSGRLMPVDV